MACSTSQTKRCNTCEQVKSMDDFYAQDGGRSRMGRCKECHKTAVRANREAKREQYSAYERERAQRPERRAAQRRAGAKHDPVKRRCRTNTKRAIREGRLVRQSCEVCGDPNTEAHHEDYTRPLDVRWLCFKHHREAHGQVVVADFTREVARPAEAGR